MLVVNTTLSMKALQINIFEKYFKIPFVDAFRPVLCWCLDHTIHVTAGLGGGGVTGCARRDSWHF